MRLILTTIILTILAQPVWADSIEDLLSHCTKWKAIGFSDNYQVRESGLSALACSRYFKALAEVGVDHCLFGVNMPDYMQWDASTKQLTQFFLNKAAEFPEDWHLNPYHFIAVKGAYLAFPCKE